MSLLDESAGYQSGSSLFGRSRIVLGCVIAGMFLLAMGIRLTDLTDAPLDYQPLRQLRGAIIARAVYYRILPGADPAVRAKAIEIAGIMEPLEPPLLENMVAWIYRLTGAERPWVVRILNAVFWLLGGVAIYLLARKMTTVDGALLGLGYFLFLPFGITVSRSFQPEALTIMFLAGAAYAVYRWMESHSWTWALVAAVTSGMTIFEKGRLASIPLLMIIVAAVVSRGLRGALIDWQAWMMGGVSVAIPGAYYLLVIPQSTAGYIENTSAVFLHLLLEPSFYVRWLIFLDGLVYVSVVLVALVGVVLAPARGRWLLMSLWVGFAVYGLSLPYTMYTHDYYNLPLVPVVALSLALVGGVVSSALRQVPRLWKGLVLGVGLLAIAFPLWLTRSAMLSKDYRSEYLGWEKIAQELPPTGRIIGLTHDYGYRLAYFGWRTVGVWPGQADYASFALQGHNEGSDIQAEFRERTSGYDYFLVTLFSELNAQPALKAMLYDHYQIAAQSPSFVLFDLHKPK